MIRPVAQTAVAAAKALAAFAGLLAALLLLAPGAQAAGGGLSTVAPEGPPGKAKLRNGKAIPPANAPKRVVRAIEAANKIRNKPYIYGGGHASFEDKGYDCSGAVSYALRAARMLESPLPSGALAKWGKRGKGRWITVYAHGGHVYAVIAGLRWDTSMTPGNGPGWSKKQRSPKGFKVRHYNNF